MHSKLTRSSGSQLIKDNPYHLTKGPKPDMHYIKRFESLVYLLTPTGPSRKKLYGNCRIGVLAGNLEEQADCQVYFPTEHTVHHMNNVSINEYIVYKDIDTKMSIT